MDLYTGRLFGGGTHAQVAPSKVLLFQDLRKGFLNWNISIFEWGWGN